MLNIQQMKPVVTSWLHQPVTTFLLGGLVGVFFFFVTFGLDVLNPSYADWLLVETRDTPQHYLGWELYRNTQDVISKPMGLIKELVPSRGIPLTYMDVIPLMAFALRPFSAFMGDTFQYLGIWGLLTYALQGGLGALILRKFTKVNRVILLGTVFFVVVPIMADRMFHHTALASHWLILAAMLAMVYGNILRRAHYFILVWSVIFAVAVMVHPYFLPVCGFFFAISVVLTHKKQLLTAIKLFVPILFATFVFWCIGGLYVQDTTDNGLGVFSTNLNALFNPMGWSGMLPTLANNGRVSSEGLAYLGLGGMLLALLAVCLALQRAAKDRFWSASQFIVKHRWQTALIVLLVITFIIYALSPKIFLGGSLLFEYEPSGVVHKIMSTFRSTGRIFWPVFYSIITGSLVYVIYRLKSQTHLLVAALGLAAFIQVADIASSSEYRRVHDYHHDAHFYKNKYDTPTFVRIVKGKRDIVYLSPGIGKATSFDLLQLAAKYKLTINHGYISRPPMKTIRKGISEAKGDIRNGTLQPDAIYVSPNRQDLELGGHSNQVYQLDNLFFMIAEK